MTARPTIVVDMSDLDPSLDEVEVTVERFYALTKIDPGDYICPSNDAAFLWRFARYHEDGSLTSGDGRSTIRGEFWTAARRAMPATMPDSEWALVEFLDWTGWSTRADLLPTRAAAVDVMLAEGVAAGEEVPHRGPPAPGPGQATPTATGTA